MPNTTTQAIILKDFTGGIWLNEGEPPSNKYASFMENLDPLLGGGVQKREPLRLNQTVPFDATLHRTWLNEIYPTCPAMLADPTDNTRYVIAQTQNVAGTPKRHLAAYTTASSTPSWAADISAVGGGVYCVNYGSSDAGSKWYVHSGSGVVNVKVSTAGAVTFCGSTFNDNLAAPTDGNMPKSYVGCVHLAYYFHGNCDGTTTNRLRWSHPGRFEDYRTNDKLDVGDSSTIIGLYSVNESLLIVKVNQVWVLTGYDPDTFQLRKVADVSASVAVPFGSADVTATAQSQYGAFVFYSKRGIYHWDGKTWSDVSDGLKDAIIDGRCEINYMAILGATLYASGSPADDTADSTSDLSWQYNIITKAWTQHNAPFRGLAAVATSATGAPVGYAVHNKGAGSALAFSYYRQRVAAGSWCDNWTGSNVDIVCQYRSPWQDARNPARKKRWRRPWFVFNKRPNASASDPATYTLTIFKDWDGVHPTKTSTFSATKAVDTTDYNSTFGYGHATTGSDYDEGGTFSAPGSGYAMQVLISSTGTPKDQWGFDSCTFKFVPRSLR